MSDFRNQSPWGTPPGGGGSGNGGFKKGPTPPNIDEVISKLQSIINRFLGGGKGGAKPIILGLIISMCFFKNGRYLLTSSSVGFLFSGGL